MSAHRRFDCDDDFFSVIDSEPKAYWLGFLAADGCVVEKRRAVKLALQARDTAHVAAFRDAIGGNGPIHTAVKRRGVGEGNAFASFTVTSAAMVADLIRHGVTPRKSASLAWPSLDEPLYRHYLRGYFDGDGCFSTMGRGEKAMTWGLIGNEAFVLACQSYLIARLGLSRVKLIRHRETSYMRYLNYGGTGQVCQIAELMYEGATTWLERKRSLIRDVQPERGRYGSNHCGRGHAYTPENTIRLKDGYRLCKVCDRKRRADYIAKDPERWKTYHRDYNRRWRAIRRRADQDGTP